MEMEMMELSGPATAPDQQEQQHPGHQSEELAFQSDQSIMNDQLQALSISVQPVEERKGGDCNTGKEEEEEEIKYDGDGEGSWRSDDDVDHHSHDMQPGNGEEREEENEGVVGNGNVNGRVTDGGLVVGRRDKIRRVNQFPMRPEAEDCAFYLRTGTCKFGLNCKFNHPPKRKAVEIKENGKDESSEKAGQTNCKYYDRPGGCKYGKACRYTHKALNKQLELNFLGLPIRLGEKECPYYMRNGSCKYGSNCRFNHPDPAAAGMSDSLPVYSNGGSIASQHGLQLPVAPWSLSAAMNDAASYMPLFFPSTQGVSSTVEWNNAYQAPMHPFERNMRVPPTNEVNDPALQANTNAQLQQMPANEFPERPGQPECSYYLRTGDCKYKLTCKFHHPKKEDSKSPACALSDLGLPLRPGQSICSYYSRYGICKLGPACKYHHPENYAHSETSAASESDQSPSSGNSMAKENATAISNCSEN